MKTIGLIGGMSWESTVTYYQKMNETVKQALGGFHSAKILMYNVDFAELEACLETKDWAAITQMLTADALTLQNGGADFIVIGTNTMHKVAPQIQKSLRIPILHIGDAVADAVHAQHITKVALLGTRFTMTEDFISSRIMQRGIGVIVPEEDDRAYIDHVIFDELCLGLVSRESKQKYLDIINTLASRGAQGVILGCTEIGMLVSQQDTVLPVFDSTLIHAEKAARMAL